MRLTPPVPCQPGGSVRFVTAALCLFPLAILSLPAHAQNARNTCGDIKNAYGPYDYRTDLDKLPIVLGAHFTPEVEALLRGTTAGRPGGDIDYTLRAIPNNHRALISMMRLGEIEKSPQPAGARYTVECYFDRAIRFRADDTTVRMIFATFLHKAGRDAEAGQQLDYVVTLAGDNPFTYNNAGLIYMDLKNYDKALKQAHRAIALGLTRSQLPDALKAVGKWVEPSPDVDPSSNAAPDPAAAASAPSQTP